MIYTAKHCTIWVKSLSYRLMSELTIERSAEALENPPHWQFIILTYPTRILRGIRWHKERQVDKRCLRNKKMCDLTLGTSVKL